MSWPSIAQYFRALRVNLMDTSPDFETLRAGTLVEGRVLEALHGSALHTNGREWFLLNPRRFPNGETIGDLFLDGVSFRLPTYGFEQVAFDNYWSGDYGGGWEEAGWWGWANWNQTTLTAHGLVPDYSQILTRAKALIQQLGRAYTWIPAAVVSKWSAAIDAGGLPVLMPPAALLERGYAPPWLDTDNKMQAWGVAAQGLASLGSQVTSANMAQLRNQASALQADTQFWNTVAQWSGADYVERQWNELKAKIRQFNTNKALVENNIQRMRQAADGAPAGTFTTAQLAEIDAIEREQAQLTAQARATLDGPVASALIGEGNGINGLGLVPAVVIGIGAAVVAGIVASFVGYIAISAALTDRANTRTHEFLMAREAADAAAYEREQAAIAAQEQWTMDQANQGNLTVTQAQDELARLAAVRTTTAQSLIKSREQTSKAVAEYNADLKEGAKASGDLLPLLGQFKWIAIAGVGALGLLYFGKPLAKLLRGRGSSASNTPPPATVA